MLVIYYKKIKMKQLILGMMFVALVVFVAGCTTSIEPLKNEPFNVGLTPAPSFPVSVDFIVSPFSESSKLGSETDLTFTAILEPSYDRTYSNTTARIDLSKGIILVSGDIEWSGDLIPGNPVSLNSRIKFIKEGNWSIDYKWDFSDDSWAHGTMCFLVSKDKISSTPGYDGRCPTQTTLLPDTRETETEPPEGIVSPEPSEPPTTS